MGRTNVVEAGEVRTLDRSEVFAGTHLRHMAGSAAVAAVRTALREEVGSRGMAVLAFLLHVRHGVLRGPVISGDFMRVVAGRAAHALLVVLRVMRLRAFRTAGRAEGLEVHIERGLEVGLGVVLVVDEALVAAFAVRRHAGTAGTVKVSTSAVAFFAAHALRHDVRAELLGIAEGGKEFILALEVELPGMADFAVGRTRLEHSLLAVRSTVGVHAPDLGALSTEVLKLGREGRIPLVNLLRNFRGDVFSSSGKRTILLWRERSHFSY